MGCGADSYSKKDMNFFQRLFSHSEQPFKLKYNKMFDEWQVFEESRVVYQGTKSRCNKYIKFMTSK